MHSLKAALIIGLAVATTSCSSTDSTSPSTSKPPPRPEWAHGTDWSGTVTMKTGTVLAASFHLETELRTVLYSGRGPTWHIFVSRGRIENSLTGVGYLQDRQAYSIPNPILVSFIEGDVAIDGSTGCFHFMEALSYKLDLHPADDGNLEGWLDVHCEGPATVTLFDHQPIVMRRVIAP